MTTPRQLSYHRSVPIQSVFTYLAEYVRTDLEIDRYGKGEVIENFEKEIADLLGKAAAVFMPSGTMCQQIALRIWCDRKGSPLVAFHPTCHLEIHEQKAYAHLHGLAAILVGAPDALMTLDDLNKLDRFPAALLLELPQREIGGQLPDWETLLAMVRWARERDIALHLDGARLWECQPYYRRSYAEIATLFDTVYVSFYKILGGIAGAVLAGPQDVIEEARLWQKRHGGNLISLYPFVLSAKKGLAEKLSQIPAYCAKAQEITHALHGLPELRIVPYPPPTNMAHLILQGDKDRLMEAAKEVMEEMNLRLFGWLRDTPEPDQFGMEFVAGDATLELEAAEVVEAFQALFAKIR